ncbi:MAG TPA: hypothetical protein VLD38_00505 [Nitrosopumilaceae archaeon]|nr:hypothetical protein [Nitrosopumilaceae archaeon]
MGNGIMGHVRIGGRGTSRRIAEKEEDNWAGAPFQKFSKERKEAAKDNYITIGRGTTKIKFGDMPDTAGSTSSKGMWVSTGRGTGRRKL